MYIIPLCILTYERQICQGHSPLKLKYYTHVIVYSISFTKMQSNWTAAVFYMCFLHHWKVQCPTCEQCTTLYLDISKANLRKPLPTETELLHTSDISLPPFHRNSIILHSNFYMCFCIIEKCSVPHWVVYGLSGNVPRKSLSVFWLHANPIFVSFLKSRFMSLGSM